MLLFKRYIKEFLSYSKWEQRGIFLLSILVLGIMGFVILYKPNYHIVVTPDISRKVNNFERQVMLSERASSLDAGRRWYEFSRSSKSRNVRYTLFNFDPNTATLDEFQALGFSPKQALSLVNYRAKGGQYRVPEDFKKSFVVSEEHYKQLAPYIVICSVKRDTVGRYISKKVFFQSVDLNTADTNTLKMLRGVGSVIAKRIVNYRTRLGGFAKNEQLLEVYGVDSSKFLLLLNQLKSPSGCNKIRINIDGVEILKRHPYITPYEARNIVYFRTKKGAILSLQQLVSDRIISKSTSERLNDYVDFSN